MKVFKVSGISLQLPVVTSPTYLNFSFLEKPAIFIFYAIILSIINLNKIGENF